MSQPEPPKSLDNSCSVIWDNTLYVYTSEAFQSIKLEEGAEWEELNYGESVQGATCVGAEPADTKAAGFWVVGGAGGTTGLQKYTYSTGEWSTITPQDQVTQNRQYHSSTYIKANDQIAVYAGSKDGSSAPSTETFAIHAAEPYEVSGLSSSAPAAVRPIFLRWSDADAVMVGGDAANTKVYLFNPIAGWRDYGASLAEPITKDTTQVQAALMTGDDGSQNLYLFDMSESPNKVSRIVLQDGSGTPVINSAPITERSLDTRQSSEGDWPSYNSTLASTATRQNYGIAQDSNGMVVFTGGNTEEPLSMFDGFDNKWMNATDVLTEDKEVKIQSASSTSSSASSTSTSASSTSTFASTTTTASTTETTPAETTEALIAAGASDDDDKGLSSNTILGITLGSIFALLILLALILFCLRRRKMKQNKAAFLASQAANNESRFPDDEKNPNAFASAPAPAPAPPAPTSPNHFRGHYPQNSGDSYSSMAILMGRMNQNKSGLSRKGSNDSGRSSIVSHHKQFKSTISKPIPQANSRPILHAQDERGVTFDPNVPEPRPRPRNGAPDAQDGTRRSSGWNRYWSGGSALQLLGFGGAKRNTGVSEQSSHYSQSSNPNPRVTQDSATVPPLSFEARTAVNRVNSGSPVVTAHDSKVPFGEGMSGKIERPTSKASSGYSSGIPESINEAWDPTMDEKPWGSERAPSSAYDSTVNFGTPLAPSGNGKRPPPGVSTQPQLAMAAQSSDMSWLNLGDQARRERGQM